MTFASFASIVEANVIGLFLPPPPPPPPPPLFLSLLLLLFLILSLLPLLLFGLLLLYWFQPYDCTEYSVGVLYIIILKLPRSVWFKPVNVIVVGIIPRPKEPSVHINSFWVAKSKVALLRLCTYLMYLMNHYISNHYLLYSLFQLNQT